MGVLGGQERRVIEYVREHPGVPQHELASHLGVSERTIRTYLNRCNDALESVARICKADGGYRLDIEDEEGFRALISPADGDRAAPVPVTPEERVTYLLRDLLVRTNWITIDDIASILYVSRNTISKDLRHVEERLAPFGLALERRPHYGIRVTGPEMARRLCMASVTLDALIDDAGDDHRASLDVISQCVNTVLAEERFELNSASYQNLIVHLAVAVRRIQEKCFMPMDDVQVEQLCDPHEYAVAAKVAEAIGSALGIEFPREEIGYIAIHLAGKRSVYASSDDAEGLTISDEVWNVVSEMLEVVWQAYRFDFRDDLELRMNLARHIVPLSVRLRCNMRLENPLLTDIKKRYALAYSIALDASTVLAKHYDSALSDDELGYIALAFALALERRESELPKKNILVVCASGQGSARLLEWRYRKEFGEWVDQITLCDVSHVESVDFSHIDYVFTTVPIKHQLPVPVRQVDYFLDDADVREVRDVLTGSLATNALHGYFDRDLFVPHVQATTKEEVIALLCERIAQVREVPATFRQLVEKRERLAQTSFGNQVALPHPFKAVTDDTFVCVGVLDEPVAWNEQEVRAVFLISISRSKNKDLDRFYRSFVGLVTSAEAIQTLVENQDWSSFLELLERYGASSGKE